MFKIFYWLTANRGTRNERGHWVEFDAVGTELAAERIAKMLEARGLEVDVLEVGNELDFEDTELSDAYDVNEVDRFFA
jgi:hypothetical protein